MFALCPVLNDRAKMVHRSTNIELPDGEITHLTEGTRVTNIETIAGKGHKREIDVVDILVDKHGGKALEWQKKKDSGILIIKKKVILLSYIGMKNQQQEKHEWKVKPDADGNWFYDED